jgi:trans-aconitate 2-methyltransferase
MREWNAEAYHRVSDPQFEWGQKVLARLPLRGDETVLDVGCGTGRLTEALLERLPAGRVLAVDLSINMLGVAREHLAARPAARVWFACAEATALPIAGRADAVFSTATLHWVLDHDALFQSVFRALKPGGRLVAQCGGGPNIARINGRCDALMRDSTFAPYYTDWRSPWNFADADATARRLAAAGFTNVRTHLEAAPVLQPDAVRYREFVANVICRNHLALLPEPSLRDQFMNALTAQAAADDPPFELDYWRLNIEAVRPT